MGKGIAMSLLWKLGAHTQRIRESIFLEEDNSCIKRPRRVFLPGGNGLQIHAEAAKNGGPVLSTSRKLKQAKANTQI